MTCFSLHTDIILEYSLTRTRVRKSRYWGEMLLSPIHCCDVTKPPYSLSGELCTSSLHSNRLYVYTVCYRRGGHYFSVLRTRHTDIVGDSSGRSYVTEQGHNVPLLRTRELESVIYDCVCGKWVKSYRANFGNFVILTNSWYLKFADILRY